MGGQQTLGVVEGKRHTREGGQVMLSLFQISALRRYDVAAVLAFTSFVIVFHIFVVCCLFLMFIGATHSSSN